MSETPEPTPGRTMQIAKAVAEDEDDDSIIKPRELIDIKYPKGVSPTLTARRTLALMMAAAAGDAWKPGTHRIRKGEIRKANENRERISDILAEVLQIRMLVPTTSSRNRPAIAHKGLFDHLIEETEDANSAYIEFAFNAEARELFCASNVWGQLNRATLLSFASKYTVTLYEIGCLYTNRARPVLRVSVGELRERLGIETKRYPDFAQLKRRVLEPAKKEIDQLAHFTLTYKPIKNGRKVEEIEISFWLKSAEGAAEAQREVDRPKVGRRARRTGDVEQVVEPRQEPLRLDSNDNMPDWS
jgi:hypothetical protein